MPSTFGGVTLETAAARHSRGFSWLAAILAVAVVVAGGVAAAFVLHERGSLFGDDGSAGAGGGGEAPGIAPPVALNDAETAQDGEKKAKPAAEPVVVSVEETGFDLLVTPAGADVSLDGKSIGVAPLRVRSIAAGRHTLDVAAPDGYFGHHTEIEIEPGKAEVIKIELARVEALADDAADDGAEEELAESEEEADDDEADDDEEADDDTKSVARRSKRETRRERRERRRTERVAKRRAEREDRAERDEEPKREKKAERSVAASDETGMLMIGSKPPCDIYVDGKKTGLKTPQRSMVLPSGVHSVRLVSKEHGLDKSFKVRIAPGKTTRAIQDFTDDL